MGSAYISFRTESCCFTDGRLASSFELQVIIVFIFLARVLTTFTSKETRVCSHDFLHSRSNLFSLGGNEWNNHGRFPYDSIPSSEPLEVQTDQNTSALFTIHYLQQIYSDVRQCIAECCRIRCFGYGREHNTSPVHW